MAESCPIVKDDFSDENVYSYVELVVQNAECETKQVAEIKFKEFRNKLKELETSYTSAIYELQTQMEKVISVVQSWKAEFRKELDSCYHEEESKIKKEIMYLKHLQDSLNQGIFDTKVAIAASDEWMQVDTFDQQHPAMKANRLIEDIHDILEVQVKDVQPIRFVAKNLETNMLCEKDRHYLGYIATHSVLPSDLHLVRVAVSHQKFIYKIIVPEGVKNKKEIEDGIECELKQGEEMSVHLNPIWTFDNLELEFVCSVHESHTVSAFLFHQHINGSPAIFMPKDLITNKCFVKEETIIKEEPSHFADSESGCYESIKTNEEEQAMDSSHSSLRESEPHLKDYETEFQENKNISFEKQIFCPTLQNQCNLKKGQFMAKIDRKVRPNNRPLRRPHHALTESESEAQKLSKDMITDTTSSSYLRNEEGKENITGEFSRCASTSHSSVFNKRRANLVFKAVVPEPYSLHKPVGVVQLSSGEIVVTDTFNDRIVKLSENGNVIKYFTSSLGLHRPSAVVQLENGYVAAKDNFCVTIFDPNGNFCRAIGKGAMYRPYGLSLNEEGQLMTVETHFSGCLTLLTLCPRTGIVVSRVKVDLNLKPEAIPKSKPRFITCYETDKILVVDLGLSCVYVVNFKSGQLLSAFGEYGRGTGQLNDPSGIACDANGNIYVADSRNHRIQVFDSAKQFICILEMDTPLCRPSGIYLTSSDHLLVLNYWDNSVAKYHLTTRTSKY